MGRKGAVVCYHRSSPPCGWRPAPCGDAMQAIGSADEAQAWYAWYWDQLATFKQSLSSSFALGQRRCSSASPLGSWARAVTHLCPQPPGLGLVSSSCTVAWWLTQVCSPNETQSKQVGLKTNPS